MTIASSPLAILIGKQAGRPLLYLGKQLERLNKTHPEESAEIDTKASALRREGADVVQSARRQQRLQVRRRSSLADVLRQRSSINRLNGQMELSLVLLRVDLPS